MGMLRLPSPFSSPSVVPRIGYHYDIAFFLSHLQVAIRTCHAWILLARFDPIPPYVWRREALPCSHANLSAFDIASDSGRTSIPCLYRNAGVAPTRTKINAPASYAFEAQYHTFSSHCLRFMPPFLTTMQNSLPVTDQVFPCRIEYLRVC